MVDHLSVLDALSDNQNEDFDDVTNALIDYYRQHINRDS